MQHKKIILQLSKNFTWKKEFHLEKGELLLHYKNQKMVYFQCYFNNSNVYLM